MKTATKTPTTTTEQPLSGRDALKALTSKSTKKLSAHDIKAAARAADDKQWEAKRDAERKAGAKAEPAKKPRKIAGVAPSKTPEARIARRNMRNMLKALTLAADESQDADVREYAEQRAAALAEKLGLATK